jgi:hypothetical protein
VQLIHESNTDTQSIPTNIYLHRGALAVGTHHIHTRIQSPTAISIDIFIFGIVFFAVFTSGVIQVNQPRQSTYVNLCLSNPSLYSRSVVIDPPLTLIKSSFSALLFSDDNINYLKFKIIMSKHI